MSLSGPDCPLTPLYFLSHKGSSKDNNGRHWEKCSKQAWVTLYSSILQKLHALKVLPQFHTPSDTVCSLLEACHQGKGTLVLTSLIWLNECVCTMWWVHIPTEDHYGMWHWEGPRYFFYSLSFRAQGRIICQRLWQMGPYRAAFPQSYATNYSEFCCLCEPSWWWPWWNRIKTDEKLEDS